MDKHALLVLDPPIAIQTQVTLNCFVNHESIVSLDNVFGGYVEFETPNLDMSQPTQVYCSPHSCYTVHTSNITDFNQEIRKPGKAHNCTKRSAPPTQKPLNLDNFRNKLPGQSASLSDLTYLEDHLMMHLQYTTYNTILLQQQISNLQNTIHHMVASLGKLDDSLLVYIWSHHFTTEFLN